MKKLVSLLFIAVLFLTACGSNWKVEIDLTPEETAEIYQEIDEIKETIANYDGSGFLDMETIGLSRAYRELGELGKAIDVYEDSIADGNKTQTIIHNLGRMYEEVDEYDLAVEQYLRLIDEYNNRDYLLDITWAYIRAAQNFSGDTAVSYRKEAEKYFNVWQLEFQTTDGAVQQAIKKLREEEKEL